MRKVQRIVNLIVLELQLPYNIDKFNFVYKAYMKRLTFAIFFIIAIIGCNNQERKQEKTLDEIANKYVKLVLASGQYDTDLVDAYYGPEKWKPKSKDGQTLPYEELKWQTTSLLNQIKEIDDMGFSKLKLLRYQFLNKQLQAMRTKLDMLAGKNFPFDVESLRLYDVVAPQTELYVYDSLLERLSKQVPGEGDLSARYEAYSKAFIIPPDKLDAVFQAALNESRKRVKEHLDLPKNENFVIEYVTDKPWSAYNWFKGDAQSLIQLNTDHPVFIDRAIDLACHEGYPGHHVYNVMLEKNLVKARKWNEFQVYPLFSPQSFIAEGSAIYGIEMAFDYNERIEFEKNTLFPLAGLDSSKVEEYYEIQMLRKSLRASGVDIARAYLSNQIDHDTAIAYIKKYLQFSTARAEQRLSYYDRYRSYVINYSLGEEFVRRYIEDELDSTKSKWELFNEILSTPRTASTL